MNFHLSVIHFYHFVRVKLQTNFKPLIFNQLIKNSYRIIKIIKTDPKMETVIYSVLFDHTFSDQIYLKMSNFCR